MRAVVLVVLVLISSGVVVNAYTPPSGAVSAANMKVTADGSIYMPMDWFPSMRVVTNSAAYAEGANMMPDGDLWYAEYASHKVRAYNPRTKQTRTVWDPATLSAAERARVLGVATDNPAAVCGTSAVMLWDEQNAYVVTCYDANTVVLLDVRAPHAVVHVFKGVTTTTTTTHDPAAADTRWYGPNDVVADGHGGIFVSASGSFLPFHYGHIVLGCVYHITSERVVTRVTPVGSLAYPNGLVMLPPYVYGVEHVLLVAEHLRNRVMAYDVMLDHDGGAVTLTNARVWSDLSVEAPLNDPVRDARAAAAAGGPHTNVPVPDDPHYPTHVLWNRTAPSAPEGGWDRLRLGPNGMKYHAQVLDTSADGRVLPRGQTQTRHWVYVSQHGGGRILKMDATSGRVLSEIVLPTRWASNVALDGVNGVVYACSVTRYVAPAYPGAIYAIRDPHLRPAVAAAPAADHPLHALHDAAGRPHTHTHDHEHEHEHAAAHVHQHSHAQRGMGQTAGPNIHHEHDYEHDQQQQAKAQAAAETAAAAARRPPIHLEL